MKTNFPRLCSVIAMISSTAIALLASVGQAQHMKPADGEFAISGQTVVIEIPPGAKSVVIPNLHAPMKSLAWDEQSVRQEHEDAKLEITPLVDAWEVKVAPAQASRQVRLELADDPLQTNELQPLPQRADGGFDIAAHHAHLSSKILRFELQPWKDTVGYWIQPEDYAYFLIRCDDVGKTKTWNVGILQGCGQGQGGSTAEVSIHGPLADTSSFGTDQAPLTAATVSSLQFEVAETGHFQNFEWRHLGQLRIEQPGIYAIKVTAKKIANKAVMDFRAISLTPRQN